VKGGWKCSAPRAKEIKIQEIDVYAGPAIDSCAAAMAAAAFCAFTGITAETK
jgi:hypothetical protein